MKLCLIFLLKKVNTNEMENTKFQLSFVKLIKFNHLIFVMKIMLKIQNYSKFNNFCEKIYLTTMFQCNTLQLKLFTTLYDPIS